MKYHRKTGQVEAIAVRTALAAWFASDFSAMPSWFVQNTRDNLMLMANGLSVRSAGGWLFAGIDDMLVCDVDGSLYPCNGGLFAQMYEAVPNGA